MLKTDPHAAVAGTASSTAALHTPDANELLKPPEAAAALKLSVRTLEAFRLRGGGPVFLALSRRAVRYRRSDIDEWLESRQRKSTSDPGPSESGART